MIVPGAGVVDVLPATSVIVAVNVKMPSSVFGGASPQVHDWSDEFVHVTLAPIVVVAPVSVFFQRTLTVFPPESVSAAVPVRLWLLPTSIVSVSPLWLI